MDDDENDVWGQFVTIDEDVEYGEYGEDGENGNKQTFTIPAQPSPEQVRKRPVTMMTTTQAPESQTMER